MVSLVELMELRGFQRTRPNQHSPVLAWRPHLPAHRTPPWGPPDTGRMSHILRPTWAKIIPCHRLLQAVGLWRLHVSGVP